MRATFNADSFCRAVRAVREARRETRRRPYFATDGRAARLMVVRDVVSGPLLPDMPRSDRAWLLLGLAMGAGGVLLAIAGRV